jgi:hypothetical protein
VNAVGGRHGELGREKKKNGMTSLGLATELGKRSKETVGGRERGWGAEHGRGCGVLSQTRRGLRAHLFFGNCPQQRSQTAVFTELAPAAKHVTSHRLGPAPRHWPSQPHARPSPPAKFSGRNRVRKPHRNSSSQHSRNTSPTPPPRDHSPTGTMSKFGTLVMVSTRLRPLAPTSWC